VEVSLGTRISLTDFVDIVSASGTPKATRVRNVISRQEYSPAADFYKRIREQIAETHQRSLPRSSLDLAGRSLSDKKKRTAYPEIIAAYKKWWGRKTLEWFTPKTKVYSAHDVDVTVNPELGLVIDGVPHLIKLYFKKEPIAKNRMDLITHLMATTLSHAFAGTRMAVLDVRRSKLTCPTVPINDLDLMVDAELAYIEAFASKWSER
jgi:hypothetical protein